MCYSEIEGSWPMSISSLFMKIHRIDIGIRTRIREGHGGTRQGWKVLVVGCWCKRDSLLAAYPVVVLEAGDCSYFLLVWEIWFTVVAGIPMVRK